MRGNKPSMAFLEKKFITTVHQKPLIFGLMTEAAETTRSYPIHKVTTNIQVTSVLQLH